MLENHVEIEAGVVGPTLAWAVEVKVGAAGTILTCAEARAVGPAYAWAVEVEDGAAVLTSLEVPEDMIHQENISNTYLKT
ncbi:hypothetical protein Q3G72_033285 [Acer saccharum]|nr:hypothetical protein Q3G72_033285 [Acer saccharum]